MNELWVIPQQQSYSIAINLGDTGARGGEGDHQARFGVADRRDDFSVGVVNQSGLLQPLSIRYLKE